MGRTFAPMLAGHGRPGSPVSGWAVEPKFDGWRVGVEVDDFVRVWTRNGHEITDRVPSAQRLAGRRIVLDGELISGAGTLADFYRLLGDLARGGGSATIVAFDVLALDDEVVTGLPYIERRALLEDLYLSGLAVAPSFPGTDLDPLLESCGELGMEGIVLKRLSSIYRPGQRSSDWRTMCRDTSTCRRRRRRETIRV
jgi:bifunctional non-homologous end joining protein LigD